MPALNVYYQISGTASNGVDYQAIGNWVYVPSEAYSNDIVIRPIDLGQSDLKTAVLTLTNSPLMGPVGASIAVNYIIGSPSSATVSITNGPVTNIPPVVSIAYPPEGAVFYTPVNIPIVACARDWTGLSQSVEFFADSVSLGIVTNPVSILPPLSGPVPALPPMPPYRPFVLVWSNAPARRPCPDRQGHRQRRRLHPLRPGQYHRQSRSAAAAHQFPAGRPHHQPAQQLRVPCAGQPPDLRLCRRQGWFVTGVEFFAGTNDLGTGPPGHPASASTGTLPDSAADPNRPAEQPLVAGLEQRPAGHLPAHRRGRRQSRRFDRFRRGQRHHPPACAAADRDQLSSASSRPTRLPSRAPIAGRGWAWPPARPPGPIGPPRPPFAATSPIAVPRTPSSPCAASATPTAT